MDAFPYSIEYYLTANGKMPFKEWLDALDLTTRARVRIRLDRVRIGNMGKSRAVGEGVRELKLDYGPGYRIYYAVRNKTVVLLLIGGDKSTQTKDVRLAKAFWADHRKRNA